MPASGGSRFHASIENFTIIEIIVIIISCDEFGKFLKSISGIGSRCLFELIVIGFRVLEGRECILINIEKFFLSRINDLVRNNKIPFFLANQKIFVYVWNSKIKDGR